MAQAAVSGESPEREIYGAGTRGEVRSSFTPRNMLPYDDQEKALLAGELINSVLERFRSETEYEESSRIKKS